MSSTLLPPPRLHVVPEMSERCDRCAAAAKLTFTLPHGGGELVFCGHHANRHTEDILRAAERVIIENGFVWQGADRTASG
ncbi:DUF7455 domain-containing protein [Pilimelia columellifera]|uniref:DUF7455 domain-containing protein n=1 Tax=Pilimelia columellifera subsp. columellifera TaxID=706583 RepID=A0ABN3N7K8_9ACTN